MGAGAGGGRVGGHAVGAAATVGVGVALTVLAAWSRRRWIKSSVGIQVAFGQQEKDVGQHLILWEQEWSSITCIPSQLRLHNRG